jgi:uncharacterized protein YneF (UPF0154 family)
MKLFLIITAVVIALLAAFMLGFYISAKIFFND